MSIYTSSNPLDALAVENFREYLRIPSVHPNISYDASVAFLRKLAKDIGLQFKVYEHFPGKPVVVISWIGQEPNLPSILLNNHMDVVPASEEVWVHKPFAADIDENGDIYGRGAQDMKSGSIQYLEAIRRLKKDGVKTRRTVHVSFMPDEEIGSDAGMKDFANSKDFEDLHVGFAMDECFPNQGDVLAVATGEKATWQFRVHIPASSGHSSQLIQNTAGEKLHIVLGKFYNHRKEVLDKLLRNNLKQSDVVSINLTEIHGGVQSNILPSEIVMTFDCRFPIDSNLDDWENTLKSWCKEGGDDVWIEYLVKNASAPETKLDSSNPYWVAFEDAAKKINLKLRPQRLEGITDIRHVRSLGIPAIGFSAVYNTPNLEHKDNEFLNVDIFLKGITIYYNLIPAIANA
ncbi:hypothetical protein RN001_011328 [Aquatica leii]|uniref:N-acyl-aliphatic-L-amino acid amidohydrolase n=1 Tax=Aquatica leii TaxID=1421715 RepID=A0AAN7SEY7_9COLE|nr:hypothetical protein RN001_011328 [Aquatica leii]